MQNTPRHSSKLVSRLGAGVVGSKGGPQSGPTAFDGAGRAFAGARRRRSTNLLIRDTTACPAVKYRFADRVYREE